MFPAAPVYATVARWRGIKLGVEVRLDHSGALAMARPAGLPLLLLTAAAHLTQHLTPATPLTAIGPKAGTSKPDAAFLLIRSTGIHCICHFLRHLIYAPYNNTTPHYGSELMFPSRGTKPSLARTRSSCPPSPTGTSTAYRTPTPTPPSPNPKPRTTVASSRAATRYKRP